MDAQITMLEACSDGMQLTQQQQEDNQCLQVKPAAIQGRRGGGFPCKHRALAASSKQERSNMQSIEELSWVNKTCPRAKTQ